MRAKLLCIVVVLSLCLAAQADDRQSYTNIFYGSGANTRQVVDVFLPDSPETPVPVIFMIHGGGYIFGDKLFVQPAAAFFVEQGYAVVTPNYRLAPTYPYPFPLNDIFCAYAWTLSHADVYGFDLSRLTVLGESAGGNGAAMLAVVDDPALYLTDCAYTIPTNVTPAAAVLYYTPVDLSTCECRAAKQFAALYLGLDGYDSAQEDAMRERGQEASPLPWLDGNEPPFLLFHGTEDTLIPVSESELFTQRVLDAGGQAELIIMPEARHGFFARPAYPQAAESWRTVMTFLQSVDASPGTQRP